MRSGTARRPASCSGAEEAANDRAMKALNNYVYAAGLLAVSEALTVARRMELDLDAFADVLNASSGRNVATETKLRQFLLTRDFAGGFALGLQAKDLATALALGKATGADASQMALCVGFCRGGEGAGSRDRQHRDPHLRGIARRLTADRVHVVHRRAAEHAPFGQ